ncbi:MAG: TolC family protein [Candidatus Zixiibacteriota bacterium]
MIKKVLMSVCVFLFLVNMVWGQTETVSPKVFSLDQCIEISLKNNATVIAARNAYQVAKNDVWTGWGVVLPSLGSSIGYSRVVTGPTQQTRIDQTTGEVIVGTTGIGVYKSYSSSVSASQSWSLGGYNFYEIREKYASRNSVYNSYQLTRQELILFVKQAYFNVLKAKMLLGIQQEALKSVEEQLKIAQTRYDLGSASFSDVLKAKVQYGDVKLALITAENNVKLAKATLNSIMGQNVDFPIEVEENLTQPAFPYSYEEGLNQSVEENPSVLKSKADLESAKAQMGLVRSSFFPTLNLRGGYSWNNQNLDQIKNIRTSDYNWSFNASISFNIFENFQRKQNLSYAKANLNSAQENFRQTKNDVAYQVKLSFIGVQQAQETIGLTNDKLQSAKEDLDLVQEKYALGAASILELLDAEVSYKQAQSDQVQALYDYNLAVAQFEQAMGK